MAEFEDKRRKAEGAADPALNARGGTSETTASTIKAAAADAAEVVEGAATKAKDVIQDAATRGAQSAGEAATRGYEAASELAERGYERGRELVSRAPSISDTISAFPILSVTVAALVGGYIGYISRDARDI